MYETKLMCKADAEKFAKLFMERVGTDYELNDMQDGTYYVFAFDMETDEEIEICRDIENTLETVQSLNDFYVNEMNL